MNEKKRENYRAKYKRYYGIEFGAEYVVHHIDLDCSNNDISNLVLLPKELHAKYHLVMNALTICAEKPKADGFLDFRLSNFNTTDYNAKIVDLLPETIAECRKWLRWKHENYSMEAKRTIFKEVAK